jgi:hypothetical protein
MKNLKEEQKEGVFESTMNSFVNSFDKYQYTFILENLQSVSDDVDISSIVPELRDLGNRLKKIEALAKNQGLLEFL